MSGFLIDFHRNLSVAREDYFLLLFYYFIFMLIIRQLDISISKRYLKSEKKKLSYVDYNMKIGAAVDKIWPRTDIANPSLAKIMRATSLLFLSTTFLFLYVTYKTWL